MEYPKGHPEFPKRLPRADFSKARAAAGISHASMAKLGKNENVTTDVLVKICTAPQSDIGDVVEFKKEEV